jgi:DNA adenine methylase
MTPRPFLKWAGGKTSLVQELLRRCPASFRRYHEPFLGGGALFFALRPPNGATLSDANRELVTTYQAVRDNVEHVIDLLRGHARDHSPERFAAVRAWSPDCLPGHHVAARMIYLNKTCFNGLYRVNRKGQFNTPIGKFARPPLICDEDNIRACSRALRDVSLFHRDFTESVHQVEAGDLVYFDPPYVPASPSADFTAYTSGGFGYKDQERLVDVAATMKEHGVHVILSNSEEAAPLYSDPAWNVQRVQVRRNINSKACARGPVGELIVT